MTDLPPSRNPYRRPDESGGWNGSPRHRKGTTGVHATIVRRRWPRRILIGANAMVALALIGAAGAYGYVNWRLGQIHTKSIPSLSSKGTGGGKPFTLLVVGSDSRAALANTPGNAAFGGASSVGGQRSDTIILVRVVPKTRQLMMLSIPRDLWGPIPGHSPNRINSAYDTGADLLVQTIQADLGIPVNHYVEVNFDTFRDITNAVGGVKIYFPTPAKDNYSLLNVGAAGCLNFSGDQALSFVRSRHYEYYQDGYWHFEAESDLARIQRQQSFIKKMIKKAEGEFTNPFALNNIIGGVTKNLTVDTKFSTGLMLSLASDFRSMDVSGIPNVTLPTYGYVTSGGADVLGLQQPQAAQTIATFNAFGNPAPKTPSQPASQPTNTAPSVTVAPSSVSIEVSNGTGSAGQAGQLAQVLTVDGYHAGITASPGYGHTVTEVRYAPDSLTAAQQVAAQIPGGATLVVAPDLTPSPYNLDVISGSSFTPNASTGSGSSGSTSSTSATSSSGSTSTTQPGTNTSVYKLPGSPAGPQPPC